MDEVKKFSNLDLWNDARPQQLRLDYNTSTTYIPHWYKLILFWNTIVQFFVTLTKTSGVMDPVFSNKKNIYFPSTKVYHKNYTENITLIEKFEH